MTKCRDDLNAITRYVSWSLDDRSSGGFNRALPDQTDMVSVYKVVLKSRSDGRTIEDNGGRRGKSNSGNDDDEDRKTAGELIESRPLTPVAENHRDLDRDYRNLLRLMEEAVMSRDSNRTTILVGGLVQHIVANWQLHYCRSVTSKFNCFFMLPFVDDFHRYMRKELQKIYEGGEYLSDVFDLSAARRALQQQREQLVGECLANKQLQEKFRMCSKMMKKSGKGNSQTFPYGSDLLDEES